MSWRAAVKSVPGGKSDGARLTDISPLAGKVLFCWLKTVNPDKLVMVRVYGGEIPFGTLTQIICPASNTFVIEATRWPPESSS